MAARYGVRVWLALVTVYLVWGSTFIALAIVIRDLPPFLAMSVRHLVAGGVLLAFALPRGDRAADPIGRQADRRRVRLRRVAVRHRARLAGVVAADGAGRCRGAPRRDDPDLDGPLRPRRVRKASRGRRLSRHRRRLRRAGVPLRPVRRGIGRSARRSRDRRRARCAGRSDLCIRAARRYPVALSSPLASPRSAEASCLRATPSSRARSARRRGRATRSSDSPTSSSWAASSVSPPTYGCFGWPRSRSSRPTPTSIPSSPSRSAG